MPHSSSQFALAIVFPGADMSDVVRAAVRHHVHVVDREIFSAGKDYVIESKKQASYINGSRIMLLFVFPDENSVLADSDANLDVALSRILEMSN
jgi:hypothetical protein